MHTSTINKPVWLTSCYCPVLQASSSEVMGRWLGVLLAETGSTTDPATLHYDYIDVETTANVIQLAKQSFWWGTHTSSLVMKMPTFH